ncbi:hypothetical protein BBW68_03120 [Candidatus Erwinia dacicola]|uniref:Uncharacterized protein n=1 Tax=Candidatus Erwinia dacicola TaxID=252393 RepID=A0A1E7YUM7_9GAMM|nr:hypothetical protein BBW68_03120 [Candidatus Erwinia dacicola]
MLPARNKPDGGWFQLRAAYSGEDEQPFWRNVNALFLNALSVPFINSTARIQIISATLGHVDGGTVSYR